MEIWKELLGTFVGQLSLVVILLALGMMVYFGHMFVTKAMKEPEESKEATKKIVSGNH